jgi:ADP-ribose pyrophosphatase YjhB (NUDIX family)
MEKRYNIRVYAIILRGDEILLTDEYRMGMPMTKFPGGGHEWGEGLRDTVIRECEEELHQTPTDVDHFYTTDFFVASAFRETDQLISIYYTVHLPDPGAVVVAQSRSELSEVEGAQQFRWIKLEHLQEDTVTFPIDKHVVKMLMK